ncbi:MAG: hypothetical protein ACRECW_10390 [Phyllobacterium sp.]
MKHHIQLTVLASILLAVAGCQTSGTQAPAPAATAPAGPLPAAGAIVAAGGPPGDIADLVGARGSSGETQLTARGYRLAGSQGLTAFWWNETTQVCARVVTANGRYRTVEVTNPGDCGR